MSFGWFIATLGIAAACSSSSKIENSGEDAGRLCAPGTTSGCLGPGQCAGAQVCAADGQSYGDCECGSGGSGGQGGTAGADASSGTGGTDGTGAAGGTGGASGAGGTLGSGGATGSGGSGAAPACPGAATPGPSQWPDSTPSCAGDTAPPCTNAGEDGDRVDAAPSYSSDQSIVIDNVTRFAWAKQTIGPNVSFGDAANHCAALNSQNYGGRADWRLPAVSELASIVDYGRTAPAIDPVFAPTPNGLFWTSNPRDGNSTYGINFNLGAVFWYANGGIGATHARCVSGNAEVMRETTGCTPPTAIDRRTSLEWQIQSSSSAYTWTQALAHCLSLGEGWRTPSVKELLSLFSPGTTPAYPSMFAGEPGVPFWTSTPVRGSMTDAFFVDFGPSRSALEGVASEDPRSLTHRVRCLRNR